MIVFLIQQYITDTKQTLMSLYKMQRCKWKSKEENSKPRIFTKPLQKKKLAILINLSYHNARRSHYS